MGTVSKSVDPPLLIMTDAGSLIIPADHIETVLKVLRALDRAAPDVRDHGLSPYAELSRK